MFPVHLIDGLSVRYGAFRTLYRMIAPIYGLSRSRYYFGEDLFLDAINPGESVLELGSGTGFLTRKVGKRAGDCVGLELERAMVEEAVRKGGATRYVRGMMESIPFKRGSFVKCISLGALHCADPEVVAAAVSHVLEDDGEFLLLTEARIIPRLVPHSGPAWIKHALTRQGFDVDEEKRVGRLYVWIRGRKCKPSAESGQIGGRLETSRGTLRPPPPPPGCR